MLELKIEFKENFLSKLDANTDSFAQNLDQKIEEAAHLIRNTAIEKISRGERTGRLYRRRGILHRASARDEFPKSDTGRLVGSIRVNHEFLKSEVGSDLTYALYLEKKSPDKGGRPWLEPSYELVKNKIDTLIQEAIKLSFSL